MTQSSKQRMLLLLLAIGFLPSEVPAFSTTFLSSSPNRHLSTTSTTACSTKSYKFQLQAISSAESYLATLNTILENPKSSFATTDYLNTLSQPTPEQFLTNLSTQLSLHEVTTSVATSAATSNSNAVDNTSTFMDAISGATAVLSSELDLKSQLGSMSYDFSIGNEPELNPKENKFSFSPGKMFGSNEQSDLFPKENKFSFSTGKMFGNSNDPDLNPKENAFSFSPGKMFGNEPDSVPKENAYSFSPGKMFGNGNTEKLIEQSNTNSNNSPFSSVSKMVEEASLNVKKAVSEAPAPVVSSPITESSPSINGVAQMAPSVSAPKIDALSNIVTETTTTSSTVSTFGINTRNIVEDVSKLAASSVNTITDTYSNDASKIVNEGAKIVKDNQVVEMVSSVPPAPKIDAITSVATETTSTSSTESIFGMNVGNVADDMSKSAASTASAISDTISNDASKITNEGAQIARELSDKMTLESAAIAKDFSDSTASAFKAVGNSASNFANNGASLAKGIGKATSNTFHDIADNIAKSTSALSKGISESTSSTADTISNASLEDVGKSAIASIKFTGDIVEQCFDVILAFAHTSVHEIILSAQNSVNSMINDATQSITDTITEMGNITLSQVLQALVTLVIAVSKMLMIIINAIVKLLSGKDTVEWALIATNSVKEQANELLSKASTAAYDATHASFKQLTLTMGDFSHHVGNEILASIATLDDSVLSDTVTSFMP